MKLSELNSSFGQKPLNLFFLFLNIQVQGAHYNEYVKVTTMEIHSGLDALQR